MKDVKFIPGMADRRKSQRRTADEAEPYAGPERRRYERRVIVADQLPGDDDADT